MTFKPVGGRFDPENRRLLPNYTETVGVYLDSFTNIASRLLKKTHMPTACFKQAVMKVALDRPGKFSRSKQSRSNVTPKYADPRRSIAHRSAELESKPRLRDLFDQPANSCFQQPASSAGPDPTSRCPKSFWGMIRIWATSQHSFQNCI